MANPFYSVAVNVVPERYVIEDYKKELVKIARIFRTAFAELPEEEEEAKLEDLDEKPESSPRKRLAAQRSQAMGAASKRLSRGVALRFILACKTAGLPMSVHLATRLLADLFSDYGRSGISESTLVEFSGGGPNARQNKKLDLADAHHKIAQSGLIATHRRLLDAAKSEAQAIRAGVNRE